MAEFDKEGVFWDSNTKQVISRISGNPVFQLGVEPFMSYLIKTPTRIFHISKVESISNLDGSDYCNGVKKYTVYFKSGNELTIANRDYSYDKLISAYNGWCEDEK